MKKWLYLFIVLFCWACYPRLSADTSPLSSSTERFPQDWVGEYAGTLEILRGGDAVVQKIPMGLIIAPTEEDSVFTWQLIYGEDKTAGLRDYRLVIRDANKGIYAIDEQNSIVIDSYFFKGKLCCLFSVGGSLILATYEKQGDGISFEILATKDTADNFTGGVDSIPQVGNYAISVRQRAFLKKK